MRMKNIKSIKSIIYIIENILLSLIALLLAVSYRVLVSMGLEQKYAVSFLILSILIILYICLRFFRMKKQIYEWDLMDDLMKGLDLSLTKNVRLIIQKSVGDDGEVTQEDKILFERCTFDTCKGCSTGRQLKCLTISAQNKL
jgi:hypothetical protein